MEINVMCQKCVFDVGDVSSLFCCMRFLSCFWKIMIFEFFRLSNCVLLTFFDPRFLGRGLNINVGVDIEYTFNFLPSNDQALPLIIGSSICKYRINRQWQWESTTMFISYFIEQAKRIQWRKGHFQILSDSWWSRLKHANGKQMLSSRSFDLTAIWFHSL